MGSFVISKRKNGDFQFVLKAGNGQVILGSEGYTTKAACLNGVESVRKNSQVMHDLIGLNLKTVNRILT